MDPLVKDGPPSSVVGDLVCEHRERKLSKKGKEEKSSRKKDEKSLENILKVLSTLSGPAEKLEAMCKKYAELFEENRQQQSLVKVSEKKLLALQREKDQLQSEQSKAALNRSRLEQLCRELQRQNKITKEESIQRIREEEERRKEVSAKFHATLAEITTLMQQNTENNSKLRDENLAMQNQFKGVREQYELREQQVEKISKQMQLEGQLAEAKLTKAKLELQAQKEILEREKAELMAEVAMCQKKCQDHEKTEESLRAQINVYFAKYDEFQNVLTKSNQVYAGFKTEMEKMSKKITRLEKETSSWKQKWESTHKALLALAAEKQVKDAEVALQARQLMQLQKLCRTMQSERTELLQQLNNAGISPKLGENAAKTSLGPEKDATSLLESNTLEVQTQQPINNEITEAKSIEIEQLESSVVPPSEAKTLSDQTSPACGVKLEVYESSADLSASPEVSILENSVNGSSETAKASDDDFNAVIATVEEIKKQNITNDILNVSGDLLNSTPGTVPLKMSEPEDVPKPPTPTTEGYQDIKKSEIAVNTKNENSEFKGEAIEITDNSSAALLDGTCLTSDAGTVVNEDKSLPKEAASSSKSAESTSNEERTAVSEKKKKGKETGRRRKK